MSSLGEESMIDRGDHSMRRPIHVALLTSGEVDPTAGGAFTADEALLLQIMAALSLRLNLVMRLS